MIRDALRQEKTAVFDIWKQLHVNKDVGELNTYFKFIYDHGKTVVVQQDDRIISTIHYQSHVLAMKQKRLCVNYLSGLMTLPDYRLRGHMGSLMNSVMDESSHAYLFTFMQAFHPQLYEKFGFEVVAWHKHYRIPAKVLAPIPCEGVSRSFTAQELLSVYERFMWHFDGYVVRDLPYYEQFIQRAMSGNLRLCVYRNEQDELLGYAFYREFDQEVEVLEVIYLDGTCLQKLLKFIIRDKATIGVQVSTAEKIERLFPMIVPRKVPFLMAKLHQKELFNKLFDVKINSALEAFQILDKPCFNNEEY